MFEPGTELKVIATHSQLANIGAPRLFQEKVTASKRQNKLPQRIYVSR